MKPKKKKKNVAKLKTDWNPIIPGERFKVRLSLVTFSIDKEINQLKKQR